jgi:hypothetical protein
LIENDVKLMHCRCVTSVLTFLGSQYKLETIRLRSARTAKYK